MKKYGYALFMTLLCSIVASAQYKNDKALDFYIDPIESHNRYDSRAFQVEYEWRIHATEKTSFLIIPAFTYIDETLTSNNSGTGVLFYHDPCVSQGCPLYLETTPDPTYSQLDIYQYTLIGSSNGMISLSIGKDFLKKVKRHKLLGSAGYAYSMVTGVFDYRNFRYSSANPDERELVDINSTTYKSQHGVFIFGLEYAYYFSNQYAIGLKYIFSTQPFNLYYTVYANDSWGVQLSIPLYKKPEFTAKKEQ